MTTWVDSGIRFYGGERTCMLERHATVKVQGSTLELRLKIFCLSDGEAGGIACVAGKYVDMRRNAGGEGGLVYIN